MTQQQVSITQEQADRLSARLQSFYDGLAEEEKDLMRALMEQAHADDTIGYVMDGGCIRIPIRFPFPPTYPPPTFPAPGDLFAGVVVQVRY